MVELNRECERGKIKTVPESALIALELKSQVVTRSKLICEECFLSNQMFIVMGAADQVSKIIIHNDRPIALFVLHCAALYCTVLYCTVLYCTS